MKEKFQIHIILDQIYISKNVIESLEILSYQKVWNWIPSELFSSLEKCIEKCIFFGAKLSSKFGTSREARQHWVWYSGMLNRKNADNLDSGLAVDWFEEYCPSLYKTVQYSKVLYSTELNSVRTSPGLSRVVVQQ